MIGFIKKLNKSLYILVNAKRMKSINFVFRKSLWEKTRHTSHLEDDLVNGICHF